MTTKTLTTKDVIRFLVLMDADLTAEQIQERLSWLNMPACSLFVIAQIRACLRDDMGFLERAALLRNRTALIPSRIRNLTPPKDEPVKPFYYQ